MIAFISNVGAFRRTHYANKHEKFSLLTLTFRHYAYSIGQSGRMDFTRNCDRQKIHFLITPKFPSPFSITNKAKGDEDLTTRKVAIKYTYLSVTGETTIQLCLYHAKKWTASSFK